MAKRIYVQQFQVTPGKHTFSQTHFADQMKAALAGLEDPENIRPLVHMTYSQSGIQQRHMELNFEEIEKRTDWYVMANEATTSLANRCLRELFGPNSGNPDCDGLVVVSGGHSGWPSLGRKVQMELGFSNETLVFDLAGYGCAGVPHAFVVAQMLLETGRCRKVCLLSADVMCTYQQSRRYLRAPHMSQFVAHCLVSDGAAAMTLSHSPGVSPVFSFSACDLKTRVWADSVNENVLSVDETNQPYVYVGRSVRYRAPEELARFFTPEVLKQPLLMHPGGLALLREINKKYPELKNWSDLSALIMRENGNLGAATVLWVLHKALAQNMTLTPNIRLIAIGPGKTTSVLLLDETEVFRQSVAKSS